jgi:ligand-binding SRPBCC domain-containing protein
MGSHPKTTMHFCFETIMPASRGNVFRFFQNPERLELLHAGWPRVRLLHHENQVRIGGETWVEVALAGCIPMVLGFRHTLFEAPIRFGEEAIHGPFLKFTHVHEFIARDGTTVVRDLLDVCWPWYYGGKTVLRYGVAPAIRRMFQHRANVLIRLARDCSLMNCASPPVPLPTEI